MLRPCESSYILSLVTTGIAIQCKGVGTVAFRNNFFVLAVVALDSLPKMIDTIIRQFPWMSDALVVLELDSYLATYTVHSHTYTVPLAWASWPATCTLCSCAGYQSDSFPDTCSQTVFKKFSHTHGWPHHFHFVSDASAWASACTVTSYSTTAHTCIHVNTVPL